MTEFILPATLHLFEPLNIILMLAGLTGGIIIGALPGLSATMGVALMVPATFAMNPTSGLIMLGAIYAGAIYGGANSAILICTPGTPSSVATTFDGWPLCQKGRADLGLYTSLLSSAFGGIVGTLFLLCLGGSLARFALQFGGPESFWLCLFGLSTIAVMTPDNMGKGIVSGAVGILVSTIGLDPNTGAPRFTFGTYDLLQGVSVIPCMIGLFSFSQVLYLIGTDKSFIAEYHPHKGAFGKVFRYLAAHCKTILVRSSVLGTWIGMLPGAGGEIASIISYNESKRWDKDPDRYGKGAVEGILVPESANNASVGGSLVPLLSLGIPGSAAAAVLAGGLMAQGLTPGPQLMEKNPEIAYAFIVSMIIANIGMLLIGYLLVRVCTRILDVPKLLIIPAVISISFLGAYALRNSMFDVLLMILSGGIAYLLLKAKIMPAGIALGLVLGRIIEENLIVTLYRTQAEDSLADLLVFSPLAAVFMAACILAIVIPLWLNHRKQGKGIALSSLRPSGACLRRYDFWVVLAITVGGAVLLRQSYAIEGISGYFPQAVYASIVGLGIFIMLMQIFSGTARKPETVRPGCYWSICLYLGLMGVGYLLIEPLGFYAATFLCIVAMTAYGTFWLSGRKADLRGIGSVLAYSLLLIAVEYGCFSLIMEVQTPTGLLF